MFHKDRCIRASVDALCRDGAGQISRERVQRGRLQRNKKLSLKNTPLGFTDPPIAQAMQAYRYLRVSAGAIFLTSDFPIFSSSSSSSSFSSSVTGLDL